MPVDPSLSALDWSILAVAAVASGVVRGFTGGALANFLLAPVLSALIGPREAVPIVLLLNSLTTLQLAPGALPHVGWREMTPLVVVAAVATPFGAAALLTIDEEVMRRAVAGSAVVFAILLLTGWRYAGRRGLAAGAAVGGASGILAGAVSLGGPPVFLYLMSGPGGAAANRANFIFYATVVQLAATGAFVAGGAFTGRMLWIGAFAAIPYLLAVWLGAGLFGRASDRTFRRVSLWGMALVAGALLLL